MAEVAIRAVGLGKRFRIGPGLQHTHLREALVAAAAAPFQRLAPRARRPAADARPEQELWALRDVSFEIAHGEVVGFVGRNGAGKSTLLKILARITEPTEGYAEVAGRVGSLLEVGTGFQTDLTGRENVFLNGAILGMKQREIRRKFDEIVAFAELERFIDTPVKHYSTGMYMRLAFAVAAHLDPEILLVDEALAVGDVAFQAKCLAKVSAVARSGRTVVFVSHSMAAVESLCQRVFWLDAGRLADQGEPARVIARYLEQSYTTWTVAEWPEPAQAPGSADARLRRVSVQPQGGTPDDPITVEQAFVLECEYWSLRDGATLNVCFQLRNDKGVLVFDARPMGAAAARIGPRPAGLVRERCLVPGGLLNACWHHLDVHVVRDQSDIIVREADALIFDVAEDLAARSGWYIDWPGAVRPAFAWHTEMVCDDAARNCSAQVGAQR